MKHCVVEINDRFIVCHGSGLDWDEAHLLLLSKMLDDIRESGGGEKIQNLSMFELEENSPGLGVMFDIGGKKNAYYILDDPGNGMEGEQK